MRSALTRLVCIAALVLPGWSASESQEDAAQTPSRRAQNPVPEESAVTATYVEDNNAVIEPDSRPLSGALTPGIGSWGPRHSFLVPGLRAVETLANNLQFTSSGTYQGYFSVATELKAIQYLGRGGELRYAGAMRFDSSASAVGAEPFTHIHGMDLSEAVSHGRWNLLLYNQAIYCQGALFGDTGMEGLGSMVAQVSQWSGVTGIQLDSAGLQGGLTPQQSIYTLRAARISETALGEVDRRLGGRSTATAVGYYGLLHFFSDGLINGAQQGFLGGYDREMTSRDRLGVVYGMARLNFSGEDLVLSKNSGGLLYGRQITGRLALGLSAGPQYVSSTGTSSGYTELDWQGQASLNLHLRSIDIQAGALRMLTSGSGVLYGARTNSVEGRLSKTMRRDTASLSFGVARNESLLTAERYNTQFLSATLGHNLNRWVRGFLSYNLQHQTSVDCPATSCAVTGLQQAFGVGVSWTTRPIGMR